MINEIVLSQRQVQEGAVRDEFLGGPNERSFTALFKVFAPQLIAFFRARSREGALAEDLTQEVMLTVYRKARQVRDRTLFGIWLFKIAQNFNSKKKLAGFLASRHGPGASNCWNLGK